MQNQVNPQGKPEKSAVGDETIQPRSHKSRKSEVITYEEKIEVEIRDIVRINPRDTNALKISYEKWASQWE